MQFSVHDGVVAGDPGVASNDLLWLGSGFSACITSGVMPVLGNFFDRLEEFQYPNLYRFLRDWIGGNPRHANVESALLALDQLEVAPSDSCKKLLGADTCKKARAELGAYCIARLSGFCVHPMHWATRLIHSVDELTTVTTTNYDIVGEFTLKMRPGIRHRHDPQPTCHSCRTDAILEHRCECGPHADDPTPDWHGAFLKLHGSTDWRVCRNKQCLKVDCIVHVTNFCQMQCECCKGQTEPVLVLPSMVKTYDKFPHLQRMWDSTFQALEGCQRLVVFGFSFPTSDAAIGRLFASHARRARELKTVLVFDAAPEPVIQRVRDLLGDKQVDVLGFPVPRDGSVPSWWKPANIGQTMFRQRSVVTRVVGQLVPGHPQIPPRR